MKRQRFSLAAACALVGLATSTCRAGGEALALFGANSEYGAGAQSSNSGPVPHSPVLGEPAEGTGDQNTAASVPRATSFTQGLFRGQDPRLVLKNGSYFFTGYVGANLTLYKSPSMVDLGVGKTISTGLGSPFYIDTVGGQSVGAWFIFGSTQLFVNTLDPYDNADQWHVACSLPWTDAAPGSAFVPFDFDLFRNPQPGPYQNRWYLLWARADTSPGFYEEHIYASEVTALSTSSISLSQPASGQNNRIIYSRGASDWTSTIAEAPGVAQQGGTSPSPTRATAPASPFTPSA